jgi:hypothetical protein
MKRNIYVLSFLILLFGCDKVEMVSIPKKTYIKNFISPDTSNPYEANYYIHVNYKELGLPENKEMTFSQTNQAMTSWLGPIDVGFDMIYQGVRFTDLITTEHLGISFYFNSKVDTTFVFCYANYRFANPYNRMAGANVEYWRPPRDSVLSAYLYEFLGINTSDSFFEITYIGNDRLNGVFRTTWEECCVSSAATYYISGDFSIPYYGKKYK